MELDIIFCWSSRLRVQTIVICKYPRIEGQGHSRHGEESHCPFLARVQSSIPRRASPAAQKKAVPKKFLRPLKKNAEASGGKRKVRRFYPALLLVLTQSLGGTSPTTTASGEVDRNYPGTLLGPNLSSPQFLHGSRIYIHPESTHVPDGAGGRHLKSGHFFCG